MNRSVRYLLLALLMLVSLQPLCAQVDISVGFGPPALPVYEQPLCPDEGYIWTPGYWAYDPDYGYYWIPGTWVLAPQVGYLWTPPWWGWGGSAFIFHEGYWGPQIGFYGGINYGFGYFGNGFEGGRWQGDRFFYNRSVMNVNVTNIHNVYNTTIINRGVENRVSFNGGEGGITARPTAAEQAFDHERHTPPIASQMQHLQTARSNPELRASTNHGKPPIAATDRPGSFSGHGVVAAREAGAPYHPPANAGSGHPAGNPTHASELRPHTVATPPSTGNAKQDQKYQQQQEKLVAKQNQEHQKLQQQQEKEDQRAQQQLARQQQNQVRQQQNQVRQQQMEQRHSQQTQQIEQRHTQQMQSMQMRQTSHEGGGRR